MLPRISQDRLWNSLMALAEIGAAAGGGVCRLALSDEDRRAREVIIRWCREVGCTTHFDAVGNVFARRAGHNEALPPVMTGSHLDSQPNGGRFDGAYGVMAGLEVLRALDEAGVQTETPIDDIVSGAALDAIALARAAPTAMIFVPCAGQAVRQEVCATAKARA